MTLTTSDVPDYQAESQRLTESVGRLREELITAEEEKRTHAEKLSSLELLQSTCAEITRLATVIKETEPEIQHERDELYNYDDTLTSDALNRQVCHACNLVLPSTRRLTFWLCSSEKSMMT